MLGPAYYAQVFTYNAFEDCFQNMLMLFHDQICYNFKQTDCSIRVYPRLECLIGDCSIRVNRSYSMACKFNWRRFTATST